MKRWLQVVIAIVAMLTWTRPTVAQLTADLAISKDDGQTSAVPGTPITYTITVGNAGPDDVIGATVTDTFSAALSAISWTCVASAGSTCTAAGSGDIGDIVDILNGGSATFTVSALIAAGATGTLGNTATVTEPVGVTDPIPGNNSATDSDILLEPATETPTDTPTDTPTSTPTDTPPDTPTDTPTETPTDTPVAAATDTPTDTPAAVATDTPTDTPAAVATDTPTDTPAAVATDTPTDTPAVAATDTPTDTPAAAATDTPTDTPAAAATDTPTDTPTATPTDTAGPPVDTPTNTPTPIPPTSTPIPATFTATPIPITSTSTFRRPLVQAQCLSGTVPVNCNAAGITFAKGKAKLRRMKQPKMVQNRVVGIVTIARVFPAQQQLEARAIADVAYGMDPDGDCPLANTQSIGTVFATGRLSCLPGGGAANCHGNLARSSLTPPECSDVNLTLENVSFEVYDLFAPGSPSSLIARDGTKIFGGPPQ